MAVHPPVHYWLIATLMRAGLNFYPAVNTVNFILAAIALLAIVLAPFADFTRLALVAGLFFPTFVLIPVDVRPETEIALAWFAGLVLLESGRRLQWERRRLFIGAFLLSYAAGLHYFALPSVAGSLVFIVLAFLELGWRKGLRKTGFICGGCALFLVPYSILFIVPEYSTIRALIGGVNSPAGNLSPFSAGAVMECVRLHRKLYSVVHQTLSTLPPLASLLAAPLRPLLATGIPVVLASTPVLLCFREVRFVTLGTLPMQLAVLLFAVHKTEMYLRYELIMLFVAGFMVVLSAGDWILRGALARVSRSSATGVQALVVSGFFVAAGLTPHPRAFIDDLALARAAGKQILGSNAIVAGRSICLWYTSGGNYYRNVTRILEPRNL